MQKHTCIIIDDEPDVVRYLSVLVNECCPAISVIATASSSNEALSLYTKHLPDLLFLDIQVDQKNGFEILGELYQKQHKPYVIFVTAYNQYAIEAFKANAIDYLLKPVDPVDLTQAVQKFTSLKNLEDQRRSIEKLIGQLPQTIRFNTRSGFIQLKSSEILYCKADRNYTQIYTSSKTFKLISTNIAAVHDKLPKDNFWRISRSVLVNKEYVYSIDRKQKRCVLNRQGDEVVLEASGEMLKKI